MGLFASTRSVGLRLLACAGAVCTGGSASGYRFGFGGSAWRQSGMAGGRLGAAHHEKLRERLGYDAQALARRARLAQLALGGGATTRSTPRSTPSQYSDAPPQGSTRPRPDRCQRGSVRPSATTYALVVLDRLARDFERPVRSRARCADTVEAVSSACPGWHHDQHAALETFGRLFRHGQQRQDGTHDASANGDAAVAFGSCPLALRTDAVEGRRAHGGRPVAQRVAWRRPAVDGSRLLELRPVLADSRTPRRFCYSQNERRTLSQTAETGPRRPLGAVAAVGPQVAPRRPAQDYAIAGNHLSIAGLSRQRDCHVGLRSAAYQPRRVAAFGGGGRGRTSAGAGFVSSPLGN